MLKISETRRAEKADRHKVLKRMRTAEPRVRTKTSRVRDEAPRMRDGKDNRLRDAAPRSPTHSVRHSPRDHQDFPGRELKKLVKEPTNRHHDPASKAKKDKTLQEHSKLSRKRVKDAAQSVKLTRSKRKTH